MKLVELYRLKGPVPPFVIDKIVTGPVTVPEIAINIAYWRYGRDVELVTDTIRDKYSDYKIQTTLVKLGVAEFLDQRSTLREGIKNGAPELIDYAIKTAYSLAKVYDNDPTIREIEQTLEEVLQQLNEKETTFLSSMEIVLMTEDHDVVRFKIGDDNILRKIVAKWIEKIPEPKDYYMHITWSGGIYTWSYNVAIKYCTALRHKSPLTTEGKVLLKVWDIVQNHVKDKITVTLQLREPLAVLRKLDEVTIGKEINITITELDLVKALLDHYHEQKVRLQMEKEKLTAQLTQLELIVDGLRALKALLEGK